MWGGAVRVFLAHPAHRHPGDARAPVSVFVFMRPPIRLSHLRVAFLSHCLFCGRTPRCGREVTHHTPSALPCNGLGSHSVSWSACATVPTLCTGRHFEMCRGLPTTPIMPPVHLSFGQEGTCRRMYRPVLPPPSAGIPSQLLDRSSRLLSRSAGLHLDSCCASLADGAGHGGSSPMPLHKILLAPRSAPTLRTPYP